MAAFAAAFCCCFPCAAATEPGPDFSYRKSMVPIHEASRQLDGATVVRDVRFYGESGTSIGAYLVEPSTGCPSTGCAGILFVHWLEPEASNSNRTQFLTEAKELAGRGTVSLLVETMWSDKEWFDKRNPERDFDSSVEQVRNLRRALDVLLAQPGVDSSRIAYVGHDFGMMYGALVIAVDPRVKVAALQAGTSELSDWFLLGRKLSPETTQSVKDTLKPLAPIRYVPRFHGAILLQFGTKDPYVPPAKAAALANAANEPKQIRYYDCGHAMNAEAKADRDQWLGAALKLR